MESKVCQWTEIAVLTHRLSKPCCEHRRGKHKSPFSIILQLELANPVQITHKSFCRHLLGGDKKNKKVSLKSELCGGIYDLSLLPTCWGHNGTHQSQSLATYSLDVKAKGAHYVKAGQKLKMAACILLLFVLLFSFSCSCSRGCKVGQCLGFQGFNKKNQQ